MDKIYLDNAATTPMLKEVVDEMHKAMLDLVGNPSSIHSYGRKVKGELELARKSIANSITALPAEIIFTSGGTEADNFAIHSAVTDLEVKRIITSEIEHHAVLNVVNSVQSSSDIKVEYVALNDKGEVDLKDLEARLQSSAETTLVSLMHVNNEIGNLLPLETVGLLCKANNAYFHSDTVQSFGYFDIDVTKVNIDFLTCSAHKFHGPKGVGFLYSSQRNRITPLFYGGAQERGLRAGTENISGILGMKKAIEVATADKGKNVELLKSLKAQLLKGFDDLNIKYFINGDLTNSSPAILNLSFDSKKESSMLLFNLDLKGIAISGGSACTSGSNQGSHVLSAINTDMKLPAVRFSFSKLTTSADIDKVVKVVSELVS